jgi:hypothetical protein
LLEPCKCKAIKWAKTRAAIMKGNTKCKEKKRFKVGLSTENEPQITLC